jgi:predicted transcriptional regulator YdeE
MKKIIIIAIFMITMSLLLANESEAITGGDMQNNVEIIKVYEQKLPAMKFIGKKYTGKDMENHSFSNKWDEWFKNGWFDVLEKISKVDFFEDSDAYIGLEKMSETVFEYWIGMFVSVDTAVPEEFLSIDFNSEKVAVCWVKGKMPEVFMQWEECKNKIEENNYNFKEINGYYWSFERYSCPRFTEEASDGTVILDMVFIVE